MRSRHTAVVARGLAGALALSLLVAGCSSATSGTPSAATTVGSSTTSSTNASSSTTASDEQTTPAPASSDQTSPTAPDPTVTSTVTTSAVPTAQTHVYYAIDTRNGFRLAREFRDVPAGADGPKAAIEAMISGPEDPDYSTTWNPKTTVLGVGKKGDVITVDLSGDARTANAGSAGAALMVQQLVWTATDAFAAPDATVSLTIDGAVAGELWGVLVWDAPVRREAPENVRMLVQIDTPRQGAQVRSPVTVTGDAAAFEANVPWRVLDSTGAAVDSGATMTGEGMTFAPFAFEVDLPPGTYTVEISEDDPSGGAAGTPSVDTKSITVVD